MAEAEPPLEKPPEEKVAMSIMDMPTMSGVCLKLSNQVS